MKKRIHVNMHIIRRNQKTGEREPPLTCKTSKSNEYAYQIDINGPCRLIYSPDKPLPCGARVYIETESDVVLRERKDENDRRNGVTSRILR